MNKNSVIAVMLLIIAGIGFSNSVHADSKDTDDARFALYINPLSVPLGLAISAEYGNRPSLIIRIRSYDAGIMVNIMRDSNGIKWGLGGGLGYRHNIARDGALTGFHLGFVLEYAHISGQWISENWDGSVDSTSSYDWHWNLFLPQFDLGHRWHIGSHFMLSVGGWIGGAFIFDWQRKYFDGDKKSQGIKILPMGEISVDLGVIF